MFQTWLPAIENHNNKSIKALYTYSKNKLILINLKDFYEKKGITIKYATPYIYEKNGIVE